MSAPNVASQALGPLWRWSMQALFLVALLAVWYVVSEARLVSPLLLPHPAAVYREFLSLAAAAGFWSDVGVTLSTFLAAYGCAVVAGFVVGVPLGTNRFAYDVSYPILSGIFSIPLIILYPLTLYVAGLGPTSKIVFAGTYGFFPVVLAAMAGVANVPPRFSRYVRSVGATRWQTAWRVLLPAALPEILSGLRVAFVITFSSVIAGEMIAAFSGVGRSISYNAEIMEPARMYALISVVVVFAAVANTAMSRLRSGAAA